jgi:predicted PhzF superfamily epimerase YddE/YHI9
MSEKNIKRAIKLKLIFGCPVTYEAIKDLSMRFCHACQMGRMEADPVTGKMHAPLECIAVDYQDPVHT